MPAAVLGDNWVEDCRPVAFREGVKEGLAKLELGRTWEVRLFGGAMDAAVIPDADLEREIFARRKTGATENREDLVLERRLVFIIEDELNYWLKLAWEGDGEDLCFGNRSGDAKSGDKPVGTSNSGGA
jgi:hypothetical protein